MNPLKALAEQFVRRDPGTLLAFGIALSLVDFGALYTAASAEGVLRIKDGIGLLDNFGLLSTLIGNAVSLYAARKYYDGVQSMRASKAVTCSSDGLERSLAALSAMAKLRDRHKFLLYGFITIGIVAWLSNVSGHVFDNPEIRWNHKVFDSTNHPLTFVASRLHNVYTWIIVAPFVGHVLICASVQLRRAVAIAARECVLAYDLLNPDQRGGFWFVDSSNILFNVITALAYIQVTMHIGTFDVMHAEHIVAYVSLTVILIVVNRIFLGDIYATIRMLKLEALNTVKDNVYNDNKLSFEILKYCYERRVSFLSLANGAIKSAAILVPGITKIWPLIVRAVSAT
ncbi:MAG: hypothetical protein JO231_21390 [Acidobacteria bacterium]|nr:hypothetical protein [Acidobacteriota bacterium]